MPVTLAKTCVKALAKAGKTITQIFVLGSQAAVASVAITPTTLAFRAPDLNMAFSQYSNTAAFLADNTSWITAARVYGGVVSPQVADIQIDTAVTDPAVASDRTLRYQYNHGNVGASTLTIENVLRIPGGVRQILWAEFRFKFSTNFTTDQPLAYPNDHKFIFGDTLGALTGRWALYIGSDSGPHHTVMVEKPAASPLGSYYPVNGVPAGDAELLWTAGTWHTVRMYFKHSTTGTSADGAFKVWLNGNLINNESGFNTADDAIPANGDRIESLSFCHNKDDGPTNTNMYLWWSRVRMYFTDPGW